MDEEPGELAMLAVERLLERDHIAAVVERDDLVGQAFRRLALGTTSRSAVTCPRRSDSPVKIRLPSCSVTD